MKTLLMTDILKQEIEKQEEGNIKIKVVGNPKLNVVAFKPDIGDIDKENKIVSGIHKYLIEESPNGNNVSKTDLNK
ncbi:MAG: hypothetical protein WCG25_05320 [bacterium]